MKPNYIPPKIETLEANRILEIMGPVSAGSDASMAGLGNPSGGGTGFGSN